MNYTVEISGVAGTEYIYIILFLIVIQLHTLSGAFENEFMWVTKIKSELQPTLQHAEERSHLDSDCNWHVVTFILLKLMRFYESSNTIKDKGQP